MSLAHGITAPVQLHIPSSNIVFTQRAFLIGHTFAVTPHALFVEPSRVSELDNLTFSIHPRL